MRESLHFTFNDISSYDMGVELIGNGLLEENFLPTRNIVETKVKGKNKPYFQHIETEPLSFPLTFFIREWKQRDNLRQIAKWLFQDYYKPLYFESNPERIYYAIFEGDSSLIYNGGKEGYVTLNVRCDSPFSYSNPIEIDDIQNDTFIYNEGDVVLKPKVWIKHGNSKGDVTIINHNTEQTITITSLLENEEVFIDFENEEIVSSLQYLNIYRFDNHNNEWLELTVDENHLELIGDFTLDIKFENIYLAD